MGDYFDIDGLEHLEVLYAEHAEDANPAQGEPPDTRDVVVVKGKTPDGDDVLIAQKKEVTYEPCTVHPGDAPCDCPRVPAPLTPENAPAPVIEDKPKAPPVLQVLTDVATAPVRAFAALPGVEAPHESDTETEYVWIVTTIRPMGPVPVLKCGECRLLELPQRSMQFQFETPRAPAKLGEDVVETTAKALLDAPKAAVAASVEALDASAKLAAAPVIALENAVAPTTELGVKEIVAGTRIVSKAPYASAQVANERLFAAYRADRKLFQPVRDALDAAILLEDASALAILAPFAELSGDDEDIKKIREDAKNRMEALRAREGPSVRGARADSNASDV